MARKRYHNRKGKAETGEYVDASLKLKPGEHKLPSDVAIVDKSHTRATKRHKW